MKVKIHKEALHLYYLGPLHTTSSMLKTQKFILQVYFQHAPMPNSVKVIPILQRFFFQGEIAMATM